MFSPSSASIICRASAFMRASACDDARHAVAIAIQHRRDRRAGDARLAGVGDEALSLELRDECIRQRNRPAARVLAKGQSEGAAVRGRIVILKAARDSELLDLERTASLRERAPRSRLLAPGRDRRGHRDTGSRRSAEPCAAREIRSSATSRTLVSPARRSAASPMERVTTSIDLDAARDRAQRRARVRRDREIAHASALFHSIWWDVRPPSAKIDPHRRPCDYLSHGSGRGRILCASRHVAKIECEALEVVHIVVAHAKGGGAEVQSYRMR